MKAFSFLEIIWIHLANGIAIAVPLPHFLSLFTLAFNLLRPSLGPFAHDDVGKGKVRLPADLCRCE